MKMRYLPPGIESSVNTTIALPSSIPGTGGTGGTGGTTPGSGSGVTTGITAAELREIIDPISASLAAVNGKYSPIPQTSDTRNEAITESLRVDPDFVHFANTIVNNGVVLVRPADSTDSTSRPGRLIIMKSLTNYGRIFNYGRMFIGVPNI